jgi:hypothetical protein
MLKALGSVLGRWTPRNSRAATTRERALGEILAVWPSIVGNDVARHTVPLERSGDALLVLTSSSAWSNQLSLLTGHIVCALNEAGIDGIERLRFRIGRGGRIPAARRLNTTNGRAGGTPEHQNGESLQASATAAEAFSRFRERINRRRNAKRADGWNPCSTCGALLPEGSRCAPCTTAELSARSARVQRLMFDVPWLGYEGISELVEGLTPEEYAANRTTLLSRWWEALERVRKTGKLSPNSVERQIASSYLLLATQWEPERITPVIARSRLGDELYDLIYENYHNNSAKAK